MGPGTSRCRAIGGGRGENRRGGREKIGGVCCASTECAGTLAIRGGVLRLRRPVVRRHELRRTAQCRIPGGDSGIGGGQGGSRYRDRQGRASYAIVRRGGS